MTKEEGCMWIPFWKVARAVEYMVAGLLFEARLTEVSYRQDFSQIYIELETMGLTNSK